MASKVTKSHFTALWGRQRGVCWICKTAMDATPGSDYSATIDHVLPKSHGGSSKVENLKLAHKKCNHERGSPTPRMVADQIKPTRPTRAELLSAACAKYRPEPP